MKNWPSGVEYIKTNRPQLFSNDNSLPEVKETKPKTFVNIISSENHPAFGQRGLFAGQSVEKGGFVCEYIGKVSTNGSDTSDYILAFYENYSIDAELMGNEARMVNDYRGTGSEVNCKFEVYRSGKEIKMGIFTCKKVKKNQELLVSYGKGWWKARSQDVSQNQWQFQLS